VFNLISRIDFTQLKKYKVYDVKDKELGKVIDFCFRFDYTLTKFILGGSFVEEFRESLGLKEDDDPVISLENISSIDFDNYKITVNLTEDKIPHKLMEGVLDETEFMFSKFSKLTVVSTDPKKIGKIVDAIFDRDEKIAFVLGDNRFVEFLEKIGVLGNFDLLLPSKNIIEITDNEIKIDQSSKDLTLLLDNQRLADHMIANYETADLKYLRPYDRKFRQT
jgi:sporulation protein YlmC with PRC-barrel domain